LAKHWKTGICIWRFIFWFLLTSLFIKKPSFSF
jgi:hypothetical protein